MKIKNILDNNLIIFQESDQNNYTSDSILLSKFVNINKKMNNYLDLCTGNGIIPLLLTNYDLKYLVGVDIQKENIDLFNESIKINNLNNVFAICQNILDLKNFLPNNFFDLITCNPPYYKIEDNTKLHQKKSMSIARHECCFSLSETLDVIRTLLSNKGKCCFIYTTQRFSEFITLIIQKNFTIYRLQFIYKNNDESDCFLVEFGKNNKTHTKILKPINR